MNVALAGNQPTSGGRERAMCPNCDHDESDHGGNTVHDGSRYYLARACNKCGCQAVFKPGRTEYSGGRL